MMFAGVAGLLPKRKAGHQGAVNRSQGQVNFALMVESGQKLAAETPQPTFPFPETKPPPMGDSGRNPGSVQVPPAAAGAKQLQDPW